MWVMAKIKENSYWMSSAVNWKIRSNSSTASIVVHFIGFPWNGWHPQRVSLGAIG